MQVKLNYERDDILKIELGGQVREATVLKVRGPFLELKISTGGYLSTDVRDPRIVQEEQ